MDYFLPNALRAYSRILDRWDAELGPGNTAPDVLMTVAGFSTPLEDLRELDNATADFPSEDFPGD